MTKEEYIDLSEYGYNEIKGIWSKHYNRFLKGYVNKKGYVVVGLKCTDGKYRMFQYHRVLWYLAYGPIPEGYQINHISELKTDNRLCNLELVTPSQNVNFGTRNERVAVKLRGRKRPDISEKLKGRKRTEEQRARISASKKGVFNTKKSKPVVAVDEDNNVVYEFPSTQEAGRNGFGSGNVSACCNNCFHRQGNRYYKGLFWYFKEDYEKLMWEEVMIGET